MKYGDDGDPVEQAFEAELFEVERETGATPLGEECFVNPDPQVAEQQRDGDESQPWSLTKFAASNHCSAHL